jgi:hypothetical protein
MHCAWSCLSGIHEEWSQISRQRPLALDVIGEALQPADIEIVDLDAGLAASSI